MTTQGNFAPSDVLERAQGRTTFATATTSWLARAAIAGPVLFTVAWTVLGLLRPGYSFISQPISGLGVGPNAALMNGAFELMGLLIIIGVFGIFQSIREMGPVARWTSTALMGLSGVGSIGCGIFTYKAAAFPHFISFLLACMVPVFAFLVTGLLLRRIPRWRRFSGWLLLAAPLSFELLYVCGATFSIESVEAGVGVAGLTERLAVIELHAWYVALAWLTTKRNSSALAR